MATSHPADRSDARYDRPARAEGSFGEAVAWMVGLSILLMWIPVVGPLVAGFVGGRRAVTVGKAVGAALVPAILLAVLAVVLFVAFGLEIVGFVAGAGVLIFMLVESIPLIAGAWLGAALTSPR
ncbi:MAG TPA: hypothetical protein VML96_09355 [Egibacteraceae bacterium]|nr:hypothetical protein [Egibacteraceae bacterium]